MKNNPKDLLKGLLENPDNFSVDTMSSLVNKSLSFFNEFIELSKKGDKAAMETALKELLDFKETLQTLSQKTAEKTGMTPEQIMDFINNPANFGEKDWSSMKEINESINSFSKSVLTDFVPQMQKGPAKARRAIKGKQLSV